MDRIGSSIPFNRAQAANAYGPAGGVQRPVTVRAVDRVQHTEPIAKIGSPQEPAKSRPEADPSRLVGGTVDPIDLARDVTPINGRVTDPTSYTMYRHPADRNQAATGIALGRTLDVRG